MDLVTMQEAKLQLRIAITNTYHDADIAMKISQASAIILRYYKVDMGSPITIPPDWAVGSPVEVVVPDDIKACTLLALSELFENREASISDVLSERLRYLIPRTPTLG